MPALALYMDVELFNRDPLLYNTPIGRLRLERHGVGQNARTVVILCPHGKFDPRRPARILKTLGPGDCISDVLFGKRFWETKDYYAAFVKRQAAAEAALEAESEALSKDLKNELSTFERRHGAEELRKGLHHALTGGGA